MTWLYDAHIHLSDTEYEHDIPLILNHMKKLRVKACCVSMDHTSSKKTLELGKKSDFILPFIGMHPEKAQDDSESTFKLIVENNEKISGIGEIGLDRTYTNSDEEFLKQEQVFRTQLSYAEKFRKPVSIHSRKTLDDIFKILPSYNISFFSSLFIFPLLAKIVEDEVPAPIFDKVDPSSLIKIL